MSQANLAQAVLFGIAGEQLTKRLRKRAFEAMLRQEVGWFDEEKHSTGVLTAQLASDATLVQVNSDNYVIISLFPQGILGANLRLMVQNIVTVVLGWLYIQYFC
jgi:ABC-type multidrug transport system fused ATPase/permease subunit